MGRARNPGKRVDGGPCPRGFKKGAHGGEVEFYVHGDELVAHP